MHLYVLYYCARIYVVDQEFDLLHFLVLQYTLYQKSNLCIPRN
jgi:hypothetical protein